MSWFKELTNKAEALLVKLDQDAAQALQNPDGLLPGLKQTDQDLTSSSEQESANSYFENSNNSIPVQRQAEVVTTSSNEQAQSKVHQNTIVFKNVSAGHQKQIVDPVIQSYLNQTTTTTTGIESEISRNDTRVKEQSSTYTIPLLDDNSKDDFNVNMAETQDTSNKTPSYSKKFTIQTSKIGSRPFVPYTSQRSDDKTRANGIERPSKRDKPIEHLGADDIRASINRSLQEYTHHSPWLRRENIGDSVQYSHFDNQPNLVEPTNPGETLINRSSSSASFSIDVPDDGSINGRSNDIAARLLKNSISKRKKSTSYLQKVINRLANPNEPSNPIFSDQTRIKLRRTRMRLASNMRRLNYYLQAYPMMKYLILIQLVIMQLLVIYVLFFYQSSGSPSELSSQIKEQQQELSKAQ